jgi:hypothetical protein
MDYFIIFITTVTGLYFHWWLYKRIQRWTDRDLALSLGPLPLALARKLTAHDPDIAPLLQGVRAVRVYVYAIDGAAQPVLARLDTTQSRLTEAGWDPVVAIRDDGERVAVLVRMLDDVIRGLAVMTQDGDQVVFVNVIGALKPQNLTAAMAALDVELPAMTVDADTADTAVRVAETR